MRTEREQEADAREGLRRMAQEVRALQAQAKSMSEPTLAYLLDMAAQEAEAIARRQVADR